MGVSRVAGFVPKDPNLWVFHSFPTCRDNARALAEYLERHHPEIQVVWLYENTENPAFIAKLQQSGHTMLRMWSLEALKTVASARMFVTTHILAANMKSRKQIFVNVWHGMPFKTTGLYLEANIAPTAHARFIHNSARIGYMIATSSVTRVGQAAQFHVPPHNMLVTGLPRNDALLVGSEGGQRFLEHEFSLPPATKIVFSMPTFRERMANPIEDGIPVHD